MDRGTSGPVPAQREAVPGRIPLAVVVAGASGLVTHWSSGARTLFGAARADAVGRPVADLLPVYGALREPGGPGGRDAHACGPDAGPGPAGIPAAPGYPRAGRARAGDEDGRIDILWWAYPLAGPGPDRLLVLAADATALPGLERALPAFAPHTAFPDADDLARRLPGILSGMGPAASERIVSQVLELGRPALEISHHEQSSVTDDPNGRYHLDLSTSNGAVTVKSA